MFLQGRQFFEWLWKSSFRPGQKFSFYILHLHKGQDGILLFFMHISFLFQLIKYGVISTSVLIEDLLNWNNLYVAGGLQNPVSECSVRDGSPLRTMLLGCSLL